MGLRVKIIKRLGITVALSTVCLFVYLFLGGSDAERPTMPDLGLVDEAVKEEDNWFVALAASTNLVSLSKEEALFVSSAWSSPRGWWRHDFASEKQAFDKLDDLISRHGELFKQLGMNVKRRGWRHTSREAAARNFIMDEGFGLAKSAGVKLLDLKVKRELDQGEFMFAFADLRTLFSLEFAVMRGAENWSTCLVAQEQLTKTVRRFMPFVTQLDEQQLMELQTLLNENGACLVRAYANAYAREVETAEARFDWYYRKGGCEQMMASLRSALSSLARNLDKEAETLSRAAFKLPHFNRFSFHFNRSLARYYEEAARIHANLLRGKYDLPIRRIRVVTGGKPDSDLWSLPIFPNWIGRAMYRKLPDSGAWMCFVTASKLSAVSQDRVVIAANRYRLEEGKYPESLESLVPKYLDAVPDDPFGSGKIGFIPGQGTIHSVGENGCFNGVIPPEGAKALHYTNERGERRWYTPYIRKLDGTSLE